MPLLRGFSRHSTHFLATKEFFPKLFSCIKSFRILTGWEELHIFKICSKSVNFQAVRNPHLLISQGKKKAHNRKHHVRVDILLVNQYCHKQEVGKSRPINECELTYT